MRTLNRDYIFYAITEAERKLWLESFHTIIQSKSKQSNKGSVSVPAAKIQTGAPSELLMNPASSQEEMHPSSISPGDELKVYYMSKDLHVSKHSIKGSLMKAIENLSFFHDNEYHKRFFCCEFG